MFDILTKDTQNIGQSLNNLIVKIENCPGPNLPQELLNEIEINKTEVERVKRNYAIEKVKYFYHKFI